MYYYRLLLFILFIHLIQDCGSPMQNNHQNGAASIQTLISKTEIRWTEVEIFIRAFKKEEILEVGGKIK